MDAYICVCVSFPLGSEGGMRDLIVSVTDLVSRFTFRVNRILATIFVLTFQNYHNSIQT